MDDRNGLLAEFGSGQALIEAAAAARSAGYRDLAAYAPMPLQGLAQALGVRESRRIPAMFLAGGVLAGALTYLTEFYSAVIDYPINVGGRPLHSWPAFLPPSIEMVLLGAAVFGVIGMFARDGLPRFHHPLFDVPRFERASIDAFFLYVGASDPSFDRGNTERFLDRLAARAVYPVGQA